MQRRTFVATMGLASLAGCAGSNNTGESTGDQANTEPTPAERLPSNAPGNTDVVMTDNLLGVYLRVVKEIPETRVVDDGELRQVEPENGMFVQTRTEVWNLSSEERPLVDAGSLSLWSDGETYEPITELPGGYDFEAARDKRWQSLFGGTRYGRETIGPDTSQHFVQRFDVPESSGYLMEWEPIAPVDGSTEPVYIRKYHEE